MKNLDVKSFVTISFSVALIILLFITVIFKSEDVFNSVFLLFTNLATAVFTYFFTKKSSSRESDNNVGNTEEANSSEQNDSE